MQVGCPHLNNSYLKQISVILFGFVSVNNFCVLNLTFFFFSPTKNLYVRDGKIQEKVKVDVIVQDNVRKIPGWIMVNTSPVLSY